MEPKITHPATLIMNGEIFSHYDNDFNKAVYKVGCIVKMNHTDCESFVTVEPYKVMQHLLERIQQLETTNKLLCKALGIRRGITDVQKSSG